MYCLLSNLKVDTDLHKKEKDNHSPNSEPPSEQLPLDQGNVKFLQKKHRSVVANKTFKTNQDHKQDM